MSGEACYSEIAPRSDGETVCEPRGEVKGRNEEGRDSREGGAVLD